MFESKSKSVIRSAEKRKCIDYQYWLFNKSPRNEEVKKNLHKYEKTKNTTKLKENLLQDFHNEIRLSSSTYEVLSNWQLPLSMQNTGHEKQSMICNISSPLCSIVLIILNRVKLLIKTDILSD